MKRREIARGAAVALSIAAALSVAACGASSNGATTTNSASTTHAAASTPTTNTTQTVVKTVTVREQAAKPKTTPASAPSAPPQNSPTLTNAEAVITQYYQDITNGDFRDAWNLGGSNIATANGQDYDSWTAGYGTTARISIQSFSRWNGTSVYVTISALQDSGAVNTYAGYYTVVGGVIRSADIQQEP